MDLEILLLIVHLFRSLVVRRVLRGLPSRESCRRLVVLRRVFLTRTIMRVCRRSLGTLFGARLLRFRFTVLELRSLVFSSLPLRRREWARLSGIPLPFSPLSWPRIQPQVPALLSSSPVSPYPFLSSAAIFPATPSQAVSILLPCSPSTSTFDEVPISWPFSAPSSTRGV